MASGQWPAAPKEANPNLLQLPTSDLQRERVSEVRRGLCNPGPPPTRLPHRPVGGPLVYLVHVFRSLSRDRGPRRLGSSPAGAPTSCLRCPLPIQTLYYLPNLTCTQVWYCRDSGGNSSSSSSSGRSRREKKKEDEEEEEEAADQSTVNIAKHDHDHPARPVFTAVSCRLVSLPG